MTVTIDARDAGVVRVQRHTESDANAWVISNLQHMLNMCCSGSILSAASSSCSHCDWSSPSEQAHKLKGLTALHSRDTKQAAT